jgi:hypothetical protein
MQFSMTSSPVVACRLLCFSSFSLVLIFLLGFDPEGCNRHVHMNIVVATEADSVLMFAFNIVQVGSG